MHTIIIHALPSSVQPLTEMSTTNNILRGKGGRHVRLITLPPSCADCLEICEPEPPGILYACPGISLPLPFTCLTMCFIVEHYLC